ncbi:peptidase S8/S53 domain-containing protein [Gigaspora rosea]|uniref:Peptidase S8/S53 domain-containing protein n=1 Tax=Gigaspora rosea TaxID=44941 RepID=A0A397UDZ6_9GLOM|nr:peptidase S8/S53 domain-containing protein [Gigaspora rosea]
MLVQLIPLVKMLVLEYSIVTSDTGVQSVEPDSTFKIVSPYYRNNGHGNGPNFYKFPKFSWDNQKHKDNENHKSPKYNKYNEDYKSPKYNKYNEDQKFPKYSKYNEYYKFPKYNDHNNHNNHNNHNDQHNHNAESSPEDTPAASVAAFRNRRPVRTRPNNAATTTTIPNNVATTTTNPTTTSTPTVTSIPPGSCSNYAREGPSPSAPGNLDCIDQSPSNLDGIYSYPSSAGSGVDVYVVDTGIYSGNKEFGNRVDNGAFYCTGCTSSADDNGHGTNVAGIVRSTYGVAKQSYLIPVKVCDASGSCQNSDIISGLSWAASRHSNSAAKKSVINMSLSGGTSSALNNAVQSCIDQGMHVAVAAGNAAGNACNYSPSSAPNAIAVGATDNSAAIASFSNWGNCVDIFAPGSSITAAGTPGPSDLSTYSGTSQATPHVVGTIALAIANSGNLSPSDMKTYLNSLATQNVVSGNIHGAPNRFLRVPHC